MSRPRKPRTRSFLWSSDKAGCQRRQRSQACPHHPDETLKFYCTSHQDAICCICALKYHKSCSETLTYPETIEFFEKETNAVLKSLDLTKNSIDDVIIKKQDLLDSLKSEANKARTEIEHICEKLHRVINEKKYDMIKTVDQMREELIQQNIAEIDILKHLQATSTKARESAEKTMDRKWPYGMTSSFTSARSSMSDIVKSINEVRNSNVKCIEFEISAEAQEFLMYTPHLGYLSFGENSSAQDGDVITKTVLKRNCAAITVPPVERMYDDTDSSSGGDMTFDDIDSDSDDIFTDVPELSDDVYELLCQSSFIGDDGYTYKGEDSNEIADIDVEAFQATPERTADDIINEVMLLKNAVIEIKDETNHGESANTRGIGDHLDEDETDVSCMVILDNHENVDTIDGIFETIDAANAPAYAGYLVNQSNTSEIIVTETAEHASHNSFEHVPSQDITSPRDNLAIPEQSNSCAETIYFEFNETGFKYEAPCNDSDTEIIITGSERPVHLQVKTEGNPTDDRIGNATKSEVDRSHRYKTLVTELHTVPHTSACWIYGLTFLADGRLVLTDVAHDSLQLFDTEQTLVSETITDFTPWGIACTSCDSVAVCAGIKGVVCIYSVKDTAMVQLSMVTVGVDCISISVLEAKLVVGTRKGVIVISEECGILSTFDRNTETEEEYRRADFIAVIDDEVIFSNAWSGKMTCLLPDGGHKWTVDRFGSSPRGLGCHGGRLLTANKGAHTVSFHDKDGAIVGETSSRLAVYPYGVAHHPNLQVLAVSQWDEKLSAQTSRQVKIIQYW